MNKHNILSFLLPTNDPDQFFNTFLPSIKNLNLLKTISTFCFVFQDKYTDEQIALITQTLAENNVSYKYTKKTYAFSKGKVPVLQMRNDAAMLNPDSLFYCLFDDDMSFLPPNNSITIDLQYLNGVNQLLTNNTSVVCFRGASKTSTLENKIANVNLETDVFWTDRGILTYGNIFKGTTGLFDKNLLHLVGSNEDILLCLSRLEAGGKAVNIYDTLIHHETGINNAPGFLEYNWIVDSEDTVKNYLYTTYGNTQKKQHYSAIFKERLYAKGLPRILTPEQQISTAIDLILDESQLLDNIINMCDELYRKLKPIDPHDILVFSLPTCEPETMFNILLPSIKNLYGLKDICTFCINFQAPYTEEQMKTVLDEFHKVGFKTKHIYSDYPEIKDGIIPFAKIRNDAYMLVPDALIYAELDDDMQPLHGINEYNMDINLQYLNAVYRLLSFDKLGAAILTDKYQPEYLNTFMSIGDIQREKMWTNRGLLIKGGIFYGYQGGFSSTLLSKFGGDTDIACICDRITTGQDLGVIPYSMCNHIQKSDKGTEGAFQHGWAKNGEMEGSLRSYRVANWNKNYYKDGLNFSDDVAAKLFNEKGCLKVQSLQARVANRMEFIYDKNLLVTDIKKLAYAKAYKLIKESTKNDLP